MEEGLEEEDDEEDEAGDDIKDQVYSSTLLFLYNVDYVVSVPPARLQSQNANNSDCSTSTINHVHTCNELFPIIVDSLPHAR